MTMFRERILDLCSRIQTECRIANIQAHIHGEATDSFGVSIFPPNRSVAIVFHKKTGEQKVCIGMNSGLVRGLIKEKGPSWLVLPSCEVF